MPLILLVAILAMSSTLFAAEDMVTIPTRQGVTQSFVLTTPDSVSPDVVLILFPGARGNIGLHRENGQIKFGESNFLVRRNGNDSLTSGLPLRLSRRFLLIIVQVWMMDSGWGKSMPQNRACHR